LAGAPHSAGWLADRHADPAQAEDFGQDVAERVEREARRVMAYRLGRCRTVVVASGSLLGSEPLGRADEKEFRPQAVPALAQIVAAVDARRTRVVVHTMRQDRLMEAYYVRSLMTGGSQRFGQQFPRSTQARLDYGDLVGRIAAVPGVSEVTIRPFELVNAGPISVVSDVLATIGRLDHVDVDGLESLALPSVYTRQAVRLARAMNPFLDTDRERARVRAFLRSTFGAHDERSTEILSDSHRSDVLAAYRPVNQAFFDRWLPGLPRDAYSAVEQTDRLTGRFAAPRVALSRPARDPRVRLASGGLRLMSRARSAVRGRPASAQ
jgi:hypothetical protein